MRTFRVDEVVAVETRMPLASLKLASLLGARVIAKSPSLDRCVAPLQLEPFQGMNGLLAVHQRFVDFTGRATLSVEVLDEEDWPENLQRFEAALAGAINPGLVGALTAPAMDRDIELFFSKF